HSAQLCSDSFPTRRSSDLRLDLELRVRPGPRPARGEEGVQLRRRPRVVRRWRQTVHEELEKAIGRPAYRRRLPRQVELLVQRQRDRKSTRLNSSHVKISYA